MDKHHIMWPRQEHSLRPAGLRLRVTPSLVPKIDREVHTELHRLTPPVPALGYHALNILKRDFQPEGDTIDDLDQLMRRIEEALKRPRAHEIEREMGALTIMALELQKPFIEYGIILGDD